jgi:hypothetical protein
MDEVLAGARTVLIVLLAPGVAMRPPLFLLGATKSLIL